MSVEIIRGNALALGLADASVDLIVTSPPYFGLRSYQDGGEHYAGQIGDEPTPAEFVDALIAATAEMVRVLKQSGSIWVNLGDKYAADGRTKCLLGIPWRYAIRCIDDLGLILRAEVIWSKPNGLPESVTDRVRRSHEQWFHFTKEPRYYSAVDEIREAHEHPKALAYNLRNGGPTTGSKHNADRGDAGASNLGGNPLGKLPGSVWTIPTEPLHVPESLGIDHFAAFPTEWPRRIIQGWSPSGICTVCGEGRRPVSRVEREGDNKARRTSDRGFLGAAQGENRNAGIFTITGEACACPDHPYPLCRRCGHDKDHHAGDKDCLCGCVGFTREPAPTRPAVVLDPFGGTGTTALVAHALGRHGISNDMSADYCRLATWRTTDPKQIAKAARKPFTPSAEKIDGQLDLLEGLGA